MPVASEEVWRILYEVARYLLPLLAVVTVFLVLFYILSDSRARREAARSLPGSGTVGELIVLSGSRDLESNTWFPVPREGTLGSIRSCDLVIPCPGVRPKHLDFSWQDGLGLLIRPHTGCEALVNGMPVTCRTESAALPLTHGAVLQVGSAILRLHLFAALDSMSPPVQSFTPAEMPASAQAPVWTPPAAEASATPWPGPFPAVAQPSGIPIVNDLLSTPSSPPESEPDQPYPANRWKEDLGE